MERLNLAGVKEAKLKSFLTPTVPSGLIPPPLAGLLEGGTENEINCCDDTAA